MNLKSLLKMGPLKYFEQNDGPNRAKRRSVAANQKRRIVHKLTTAQKRKRRKAIKHQRKQGAGLRKA